MSIESTGSEATARQPLWKTGQNQSVEPPQLKVVTDGVTVSGDAYAPTLITAGTRATGSPSSLARRRRLPRLPVAISPSVHHVCQAMLKACADDMSRAIDSSADPADAIARNNALEQLRAKLSDLWGVRAQREESWAELINMVQAILVKRRVEDFSKEQLIGLRSMFEMLQQESVLDENIVNAITVKLLEAGLDVFREIE